MQNSEQEEKDSPTEPAAVETTTISSGGCCGGKPCGPTAPEAQAAAAAAAAAAKQGSCCGGRPCNFSATVPAPADSFSRYPKLQPSTYLQGFESWKQAAPPAQPQFGTAIKSKAADGPPPPFTYTGANLSACRFPLGGFGSGNVILGGDGTLQDWTVQNQVHSEGIPMHIMPATWFACSCAQEGAAAQSFVLCSPETYTDRNTRLPSNHPAYVPPNAVARLKALPGIRSLSMTGRYPIADVNYDIVGFPVELSLEAMTPLIPHNVKDSSLPCAVFTFSARNTSNTAVTLRMMQAQQNFVGWDGQSNCSDESVVLASLTSGVYSQGMKVSQTSSGASGVIRKANSATEVVVDVTSSTRFTTSGTVQIDGKDAGKATVSSTTGFWGGNVNTPINAGALTGLIMTASTIRSGSPSNGNLAVHASVSDSAVASSVIVQATTEADLFHQFCNNKDIPAASASPSPPSDKSFSWSGGVVQTVTIPAGQTQTVTFISSWSFPNRARNASVGDAYNNILPEVLGNFYSTWFSDASVVARYVQDNMSRLLSTTRTYRDIMFRTTLPPNLLDTAAGRVAVMRSGTMWRNKDGTVMGTEGNGCCPLNCTHVYGYTTLMERLFPDVAKNMRESDFIRNFDLKAGGCSMRFGTGGWAIDGALACIIKTYLVVQQSDSTLTWLPSVWKNVKAQMDDIITKFDTNGNGVITLPQQNTYDTAMNGANTFIGSYYITALRACAKMAKCLGDNVSSKSYSDRAEMAAVNYDKICWKEEFGYFVADVTIDNCKYSYGPGCFVDQVCGAGLSFACGLGYLCNSEHEHSARKAVVANNIVHKPPFQDFQQHFFDGDTGITVCSYPNGKLGDGMTYENLVSTGFTYPVLAGLLHDRDVDTAMVGVNNIRQRQDGRNRSPWNEPECDVLYSRMMAAWNLYDQALGFNYDSQTASLAFDSRFASPSAPQVSCFVTLQDGWGEFTQTPSSVSLSVAYGSMSVGRLVLASDAAQATAVLDGKNIDGVVWKKGGELSFPSPLQMATNQVLTVTFTTETTGVSRGCADEEEDFVIV